MAARPLRNAGAIARFARAVAVAVLVAACATTPKYGPDSPVTTIVVPVERLQYPPLVPKLPVTAGIYYSPEFREAVAMVGGGDSPRYRYEIGAAAVALFDRNAAAMFARTVELPSLFGPGPPATGIDFVLVPRLEQHVKGFALGVDVYGPDGVNVAKCEGMFVSPGAPNGLDASNDVTAATTSAIPTDRTAHSSPPARNVANSLLTIAVGDLATTLVLSPELSRWAESRGAEWEWSDVPAHSLSAAPSSNVAIAFCPHLRICSGTKDADAVAEALHRLDPAIHFLRFDELQRAFYPWLGYRHSTDEQFAEWLRRPAVTARAASVGVRYLVLADEFVFWKKEHGGIFCGGVPPGGCFGLAWWTRNESARLRVFDFASAADAGDVNYQREDVSWVIPALGLPLPIPIPSSGDSMPDAIAKQLLPLIRAPK